MTLPCEDPACRGWLHMESDTYGPGIERCDTCRRFNSDDAASAAHARDCACGMVVAATVAAFGHVAQVNELPAERVDAADAWGSGVVTRSRVKADAARARRR